MHAILTLVICGPLVNELQSKLHLAGALVVPLMVPKSRLSCAHAIEQLISTNAGSKIFVTGGPPARIIGLVKPALRRSAGGPEGLRYLPAAVTAIMSNVLARPARPVPRTNSFEAAGGRCGS